MNTLNYALIILVCFVRLSWGWFYNIDPIETTGWVSNSCCTMDILPYYRQTNQMSDILIAMWQENAPSNWSVVSGFLRFTSLSKCVDNTFYNIDWNGRRLISYNSSAGCLCPPALTPENVTLSFDSTMLMPLNRGAQNTISMSPSAPQCVMVGGVPFGPSPNTTAIFQIELLYCGDTSNLRPPKECDGGSGCDPVTCKCNRTLNYTAAVPIQPYCLGCGNGIWDPPLEECDKGAGCLPNCTCDFVRGYRPNNNSHCNGCGNGIADINEECDGGTGCLSNCTCNSLLGYVPKRPRVDLNCTFCGNGVVDPGEQCDSGIGCNISTCQCEPGYQPQQLPDCAQCGNQIREIVEECDGGIGCTENCTCLRPQWIPQNGTCLDDQNINETPTALIVGVVLGGFLALVILVFLILVFVRKAKKKKQKATGNNEKTDSKKPEDSSIPTSKTNTTKASDDSIRLSTVSAQNSNYLPTVSMHDKQEPEDSESFL